VHYPTLDALRSFLPGRCSTSAELPWIPSGTPGKSAKPLRFLRNGSGFVELLRMEPGTLMPLHRHSGEIHAYNLSGSRQLCTGEVIGPGDYVYEPPGNIDWWKVIGDETMLALVVVMGDVAWPSTTATALNRACRRGTSSKAEWSSACQVGGDRAEQQVDRTHPSLRILAFCHSPGGAIEGR
jgi:2,4'-dihydroxyacetophenone dioxygenase